MGPGKPVPVLEAWEERRSSLVRGKMESAHLQPPGVWQLPFSMDCLQPIESQFTKVLVLPPLPPKLLAVAENCRAVRGQGRVGEQHLALMSTAAMAAAEMLRDHWLCHALS